MFQFFLVVTKEVSWQVAAMFMAAMICIFQFFLVVTSWFKEIFGIEPDEAFLEHFSSFWLLHA